MMTASQTPGWVKAALLVSLALNVFLGGLIVGRVLLSPFNSFTAKPELKLEVLVDRLTAGMSEADQLIVRVAVQRRQAALTDKLNAARMAKASVKDLILSDHVTNHDLQGALDRMGQAMEAIRTELTGLMMEIVPNLSLEGRRKIMDVLDMQGGRGGPPWRR